MASSDSPSLVDLIKSLPDLGATWGPPVTTETTLNGVPYAPYSKGDKLGRMADWTADSKDGRDGRGGRQQYNRNYRDQQVYGAGSASLFVAPVAEDESSFSVVSNVRDSAKTRFAKGAIFSRGGRGQRGGRGDTRGGRQQFQRSGRGGPQFGGGPGGGGGGGYDQRGGPGGRGNAGARGRRFGWKDYDKPARNRDASINIKADWKLLEEIDFNRLAKLNLDADEGEDVESYGFLYYYDRSYDKPMVKSAERKLLALDRAAYNVTTSADPVIQELADKDEATIFATDSILSMLMCSTRSVYPWDIVIIKHGNKVFIDKRDNAALDMVTVNENAADAPLEASEGSKDLINQPPALAEEATYINHNFPTQAVLESETQKVEMAHENHFYNASEETAPPASKAYKYRRFDLSTSDEDPMYLIVRTELDAVQKNAISGEDQFVAIHALNEFDSKAQGSGGALDWRTKLVSQRGAVVATEMKNNSCKLARWTVQSILAKADVMKLGFVSRANPKTNDKHVVLGVVGWKPKDFANQMNLSLSNGWGIVRTIADMCLKREEGKYVLVKDPNKSILRLYEVPSSSFDDDAEEENVSSSLRPNTGLLPTPKMAPTKLTSSSSSRTPQKSTKSSSSSGFVSKTPLSAKTKPKPNGSILNYFKKAADESLFIAEGVVADSPAPEPEKEDDNDIYGASDADGSGIQLRFNEVTSSVKKRKLSPQPQDEEGDESPSKQSLPERQNEEHKSPESLPPQNPRPKKSAKTTKKKNNPFLDDSSDDDDDGGDRNDDISTPKSGTSDISQTALKTAATTTTETSGNNVRDSEDRDDDFDPDMQADYEGDGQFADQFGEGDEDDDLFAGGEEFKEMRYMQEQARLAAEEGNHSFDGDDDNLGPDAMVESCPICNGSLSGVTEDQATAHVNACLDGNPTPLPTAASLPKTEQEKRESGGVSVEAPDLGKRFAKAAVARPGQANPINLGGTAASVDGGPSKSAFAKLMTSHAEDSAWATAAAAEQASRGKPAYKRTCPFYKIMPGFSICVDAFRYGAVEGCKAYFLSHFHSDHYMGLTAHWTHGPIYCSKVTGALVKMQLKTAAKYVVELAFDETAPVPGTQGVTVTMIPANHCPGSSLFLFEKSVGGTRTQRILHCGDFRACPAHVEHPQLRPETTASAIAGKTKQQKIDVCYLDTTYLNPRYSFPPQEDVVRSCAEVCLSLDKGLTAEDDRAWNSLLRRREGGGGTTENVSKFFPSEKTKPPPLAAGKDNTPSSDLKSAPDNAFTGLKQGGGRKNRLLVVCGTYSIGKERICKAIALALKTKIYASAAKIRMCQQLDDAQLADLMTSNPREAQVHMQMLMEIRPETLAEYLELHRAHGFSRVVGFRPSGWNFRPNNGGGSGGGGGGIASGIVVGANMPPSSVPSTSLLHGTGWRPRFAASSLVPQRGSSGDAMCFGVPYSEHSSFRELALFLMALRIDKVVPTVNVGSEQSRRRMKAWTDRWLAERRRGGLVRVLKEGEGGVDGGEALWDGKQGTGGGVFW
ncbi:eukaryotic translation initiation factor 3 subunit 7-domain-containing protein [Lasiosphaeria miniovina]|uniref:Eukaryotic translation initiation factor 3 subunit D n=1 Tax=Lasiosphaeria miniovina TaxID=1954250 RepID=A0AA40DX83_9PEZI|nr:eukaryotic translation initiation factor 3 subunit 7-domain-containing protein [Lasiosphaeria miniovina]KAK0716962.1 eukaryotic translation initiation factor 3 subunit 7-domain-containing protein [Lasiosphaeria miniovina]